MSCEENGWDASAQAWIQCVDEGDANRNHLLDPVMLGLCGPLAGQRILDVGCGEGRFCRMLGAHGAVITGLDPTEDLLSMARGRHPEGKYLRGFAENLPFHEATFDGVVSYITLVDIENFREAILEMARVLKPGGALVVANLCSFATATPFYWWKDADNQKLFWTLDDYMSERSRFEEWRGIRVRNWHRPLSSYMQAFLAAGLLLEHFDEPMPTESQIAAAPSLADHGRKPDFYVMRWRKPALL